MKEKLRNLKEKVANKLFGAKHLVETKIEAGLDKMDNGDAQIIVMIGIILIAVFLLVFFRDSLKSVIQNAITNMETKLNGLLN